MSFKKNIIKKYLGDTQVLYIIGHHAWRYTKVILVYIVVLAVLFYVYEFLHKYWQSTFVNYLFGVIGVVIYAKFVVNFLDIYLDSLVATNYGIILFKWDGILKHKKESIERASIDAVSDEQSGILDIILNKGDIKITIPSDVYIFGDVLSPSKHSSKISEIKDSILSSKEEEEEEQEPQPMDKFDVLVETLGEVIIDYMRKNKLN